MTKRKEHKEKVDELELQQMEFRVIMGDSWEHLEMLLENVFCTCDAEGRKLIDYKIFLNDLNDLILRGRCSNCDNRATRYVETGEQEESFVAADRIRKMARTKQK